MRLDYAFMSAAQSVRDLISRRSLGGWFSAGLGGIILAWNFASGMSTASYVMDCLTWLGKPENAPKIAHIADLLAKWAPLPLFLIGLAWLFYIAKHPKVVEPTRDSEALAMSASPADVTTTPEIPDSEVITPLLERLPGDQRQLLLSLNLGEKVFPEDEPGLEDLERNRLAQRLRRVTGRDFLFRLHPDNAAQVNAFLSPTQAPSANTTRIDAEPESSSESIEQLRSVAGFYQRASGYALEYINVNIETEFLNSGDGGQRIIGGLMGRYFLSPATQERDALAQKINNLVEPLPRSAFRDLAADLCQAIYTYIQAATWITMIGENYGGGKDFYRRPEYGELYRRHQRFLEKLRDIQYRTDLAQVSSRIGDLSAVLQQEPLSGNGEATS